MAFSWRGNVELATRFVDEHNMILKRDVNMSSDRDQAITRFSGESLWL